MFGRYTYTDKRQGSDYPHKSADRWRKRISSSWCWQCFFLELITINPPWLGNEPRNGTLWVLHFSGVQEERKWGREKGSRGRRAAPGGRTRPLNVRARGGGTGRPRPRARSPGEGGQSAGAARGRARPHTPAGSPPHRAPSPPRAAQAGAARVDSPRPSQRPRRPPTAGAPEALPALRTPPAGSPHAPARLTSLSLPGRAGARAGGRGAGRGALAGQPAPGAAAPRLAGLRGAAGAHLLRAGVRAASCGDGLRRRRLTAGPRPLPSWRARARAAVCARRRGLGGRGERRPGPAGPGGARAPARDSGRSPRAGAGVCDAVDGETGRRAGARARARANSAQESRLRGKRARRPKHHTKGAGPQSPRLRQNGARGCEGRGGA